MTTTHAPVRIIISGGGTGGHIYPAIAIANALKELAPAAEILFVGAEGKMEMQKVPQAGYRIEGLPVAGLQRRLTLKNLAFPFKLAASLLKARRLVRNFRPQVAVGVGGYASGPLLYVASQLGVPTLIQEQNSYAGLTNKWLSRWANRICVAYEGMEAFFPAGKITLTGNPVRQDIVAGRNKRQEALAHFSLWEDRPTLLVVGGSLGARTLNESVLSGLDRLAAAGYQLIWQTGKSYFEKVNAELTARPRPSVRVYDFIAPMDLAYAAADVVISRAGALSISELCVAGKPAILVPSPNVAEDHQTKNAQALTQRQAALLVKDAEAGTVLITTALDLLANPAKQVELARNSSLLARPDAAVAIARHVLDLIANRH